MDVSLSLQGLEEEWSGLGDSPTWDSLREYLDQVRKQMHPSQAHRLFEEMRRACQLVSEANELTAECRPEESLQFEVDLTSAVPSSVVIRVLQADSLCDDGVEEPTCSVLYLWSLSVMEDRLQRMRDYHEARLMGEGGSLDPLLDPWHEPHPGAVAQRLAELELMLTMEREASTRNRRLQQGASRRKVERCNAMEEELCLRDVLSSWGSIAKVSRRHRPGGAVGAATSKQGRGTSPSRASPSRPSSPSRSARAVGRAVEGTPRREEEEGSKLLDTSIRRRGAGSFDFNYRGGFKAGAVQASRTSKAPTPAAPKPAAQTPARSPSVAKRGQAQPSARKTRTPAAPRGAATERSEESEAAPRSKPPASPLSPPEHAVEQPSFVSSDGKITVVDEVIAHGVSLNADVDAGSDGGTVSRFISGIVTGNTGDGEDGARVAEAYETTLLKRQLEQAWQLGYALRSQMPEQEPVAGAVEEPARTVIAPPMPERQLSYHSVIQAQPGRQVWGVASPWPHPGIVSPRYTPDCHAGHQEGIPTLPRCVVTYTTAALVPSTVPSRSPTPLVSRPS